MFSATGSNCDSAGNAAKCAVLTRETSYFSDINDSMAERGGFEPSVRFCKHNSRRVRKLQPPRMLRENLDCEHEV